MFKLKRELSKLLEEVLCQSITLSMLFCISKIALTVENGTCREFFSNYFVFSEIAFTVENGPYREFFFISIAKNIALFSRHNKILSSKL